ncbi:hypothetical protein CDD83_3232 [Cordyceps sp. RAO-2017]|nr:hypothetical protein CDD83_3232 [Cordyceps sp. RAO-2017]
MTYSTDDTCVHTHIHTQACVSAIQKKRRFSDRSRPETGSGRGPPPDTPALPAGDIERGRRPMATVRRPALSGDTGRGGPEPDDARERIGNTGLEPGTGPYPRSHKTGPGEEDKRKSVYCVMAVGRDRLGLPAILCGPPPGSTDRQYEEEAAVTPREAAGTPRARTGKAASSKPSHVADGVDRSPGPMGAKAERG